MAAAASFPSTAVAAAPSSSLPKSVNNDHCFSSSSSFASAFASANPLTAFTASSPSTPLISSRHPPFVVQLQQQIAANSPANDSGIGTTPTSSSSATTSSPSSSSIQQGSIGAGLPNNNRRMRSTGKSVPGSQTKTTSAASTSTAFGNATNAKKRGMPLGPQLSWPCRERIICERDSERIVKETETLIGGQGTSREQLITESRLSRECLQHIGKQEERQGEGIGNGGDGVRESRRYYMFDPVRHEYRLYYAREIRFMYSESNGTVENGSGSSGKTKSATNLRDFASSMDQEAQQSQQQQTRQEQEGQPLRRRHSAGSMGRLRRAVPPPLPSQNGHQTAVAAPHAEQPQQQQQKQQQAAISTTRNGICATSWIDDGTGGQITTTAVGKQQQLSVAQPTTIRRAAFERNSASRKPEVAARRRQWSGGVKRATALKLQQEMEQQQQQQQRRLGIGGVRTVASSGIASTSFAEQQQQQPALSATAAHQQPEMSGAAPVAVTNQLLKQLLRPLPSEQTAAAVNLPSLRQQRNNVPLADSTKVPLLLAAEMAEQSRSSTGSRWWRPTRSSMAAATDSGGIIAGSIGEIQLPIMPSKQEEANGNEEDVANDRRRKRRNILARFFPCFTGRSNRHNGGKQSNGKNAQQSTSKTKKLQQQQQRWLCCLLGVLLMGAAAAGIAIVLIIYCI